MIACEQALGGMEGERKQEGLYAHLKFYCSAPSFEVSIIYAKHLAHNRVSNRNDNKYHFG